MRRVPSTVIKMSTATKSPVMLYTEQTPNPESLKFVTNRMLYQGTADFREEELAVEWSPLGAALFELPYVKGVYICNNFVTISKEFNYAWEDIMLNLKQFVKTYVESGKEIVKDGFEAAKAEIEKENIESYEGDDAVWKENVEWKEGRQERVMVKQQGTS